MSLGEDELSTLEVGIHLMVFYHDDVHYHERVLLWKAGGASYGVVTPDLDVFVEDFTDAGVVGVTRCGSDLRLPAGLPGPAYRFEEHPSRDMMRGWIFAGREAVAEHLLRREVPNVDVVLWRGRREPLRDFLGLAEGVVMPPVEYTPRRITWHPTVRGGVTLPVAGAVAGVAGTALTADGAADRGTAVVADGEARGDTGDLETGLARTARGASAASALRPRPARVVAPPPGAGVLSAVDDAGEAGGGVGGLPGVLSGGLWLASEPMDGIEIGTEVTLPARAFIGGTRAIVPRRDGLFLCAEYVQMADAPDYARARREIFRPPAEVPPITAAAATGAAATAAATGAASEVRPGDFGATVDLFRGAITPAVVDGDKEDLRTLAVTYDEQGERWRSWREVAAVLYADTFPDFPVEGPRTMLWIVRSFAKEGLDPVTWLERHLSLKKFSDTDRSVHELRVLAEVMRLAGSYDQLNLASLACMEMIARRWQLILEAHHHDPLAPNYEAAEAFTSISRSRSGVAPMLAQYVAKVLKDDADVEKQRGKVREMKTAAPKRGAGRQ